MTAIGIGRRRTPAQRLLAPLGTAAAALWILVLVLWPVTSNHSAPRPDDLPRAAGEGLYKSAPATNANFGLMGVNLYQTSEGKKRWAIHSAFAELHRKENYSFLQTVTAEFTAQKTGNVVVTKSNYGRTQLDKQNVDLEGDVSIRSRKGYLFTMDRLHYDGATHVFTSEDAVKMVGPVVAKPRMKLSGVGLMAEIDSEHFYLRKNVVAHRKLGAEGADLKPRDKAKAKEDEGWLKITSHSGEFFTEEHRSIFIKKVKAVTPKIEIESDVLELQLAQDQESMQANGNVVMHSRDRVGRAESATLELGTNRIILEGKARVDSKDNHVRGRRIMLYTDEDRVEVEEAEGKGQG